MRRSRDQAGLAAVVEAATRYSGTGVSEKPLVSIVIAFFNVAPYIAEAIDSVLAQSWTGWELILVDDGSTDASRAIVERYCQSDAGRLRCLEHPGGANRGLSESRNLGWRAAHGELVAFLDADDRWLPDKLERQIAVFEQFAEVEVCVGASLYWHRWDGSISSRMDEVLPVGGPQAQINKPGTLVPVLYPLGQGRAPSMNTVVARRDIAGKIGMFEPCFRSAFEDQAFLIKVYLFCSTYILPDVLDHYRRGRPDSITEQELTGSNKYDRNIDFYRWLSRYLEKLGGEGRAHARVAGRLLRSNRRDKWRRRLKDLRNRLLRR